MTTNTTTVAGCPVTVRVFDANQRGDGWPVERGQEWPAVFLASAYDSIQDLADAMAADAVDTDLVEVEVDGGDWTDSAVATAP